MATALDVLKAARSHLDDVEATLWTDPKLFPKLQEAHRELQLKLRLNGVPVLNAVTAVLSVPALMSDLTLATGYPTNLVSPIWLKERNVGDSQEDFVDMSEVDFIPNIDPTIDLIYWAWQGEKVLVLASTQASEVQIRYNKGLTVPTQVNDAIGVIGGELYLGYRTAALCLTDRAPFLNIQADKFLEDVVRLSTKEAQNLPARRKPYHRRGRLFTSGRD